MNMLLNPLDPTNRMQKRAGQFVFRGKRYGSETSPPNCWRFPGATTIRSMPLPRAWHGLATPGPTEFPGASRGR